MTNFIELENIAQWFPIFNNQKNTLVFLESGDDVLNYVEAARYFLGSNIDITYGGSHSYESISNKLEKISRFIEI